MAAQITKLKTGAKVLEEINRGIRKLDNGCWEWVGRYNGGCPYIYCFGTKNHVTKILWGVATERKYPFRKVEMECGNKRCVNPAHVKIDQDQYDKKLKRCLEWC